MATEFPGAWYDSFAPWIYNQATDYLRGDVALKGGITGCLKAAHLAEGFGMNFEIHHGGNSLNNVAHLHISAAIRNCEWFEVLLPAGRAEVRPRRRHRGRFRGLRPRPDGPRASESRSTST